MGCVGARASPAALLLCCAVALLCCIVLCPVHWCVPHHAARCLHTAIRRTDSGSWPCLRRDRLWFAHVVALPRRVRHVCSGIPPCRLRRTRSLVSLSFCPLSRKELPVWIHYISCLPWPPTQEHTVQCHWQSTHTKYTTYTKHTTHSGYIYRHLCSIDICVLYVLPLPLPLPPFESPAGRFSVLFSFFFIFSCFFVAGYFYQGRDHWPPTPVRFSPLPTSKGHAITTLHSAYAYAIGFSLFPLDRTPSIAH